MILSALLTNAINKVTTQVPNIHQKVGQDIQIRSRNSKSNTPTISAANRIEGKNTTNRMQSAKGIALRVFIQLSNDDIVVSGW